MIGKISKGKGFGSLCRYLLDPEKEAEIIGSNLCATEVDDIAEEFRMWADVRSTVKKPVVHMAIGFSPADGELDNSLKAMVAGEILEKMGHGDCQYLIVSHSRHDPDHPVGHDHDHIHIATTAVDLDGRWVSNSFDQYRLQAILREIEKDYHLQPVQSSWEMKVAQVQCPEIQNKIQESLVGEPSLDVWLDRLEKAGINTRFNVTDKEKVRGITYLSDGESYRGQSIGYSWPVVQKFLQTSPQDRELIREANAKAEQESVKLNDQDQATFERACQLASGLLEGKENLENNRLLISRQEDELKVVRKRPHKLMFAAKQDSAGKWQAIGYPHVDKRDTNLLDGMAKRLGITVPEQKVAHISSPVTDAAQAYQRLIEEIERQMADRYRAIDLEELRDWYRQSEACGRSSEHLSRISEIGQTLRNWQDDNSVGWDKVQEFNWENIQKQMAIDKEEYQKSLIAPEKIKTKKSEVKVKVKTVSKKSQSRGMQL